jgi:hypothetical protein
MTSKDGFLFMLIVAVFAHPASAHHILGIPHYAYDEQYPQAPVLTYLVDTGPFTIQMTGYPGKPSPGEPCALNVYIRYRETGVPLDVPVELVVYRDRLIGEDPVVYGPLGASLEDAVYKFHPKFGGEANYLARITFEHDGEPWIVDLPMVVGEPGSPWAVVAGVVIAVVAFLIIIRAVRIKMDRRGSDELQCEEAIE